MMGRRKIVNTRAVRSRKLASVSCMAERMYWRIYMASDNYGTMSGDPWDVWHEAAPGVVGVDESAVAQAIIDLESVGLLQIFTHEDKNYIHVINHDIHQSADFIRKRGTRRTPEPPTLNTLQTDGFCPNGSKGRHKAAPTAPDVAPITSTSLSTIKPSSSQTESVPVRNKRRTNAEIRSEIDAHRIKLGHNASLVDQLVECLAEENKTGTVAEGKALRILWLPIASLVTDMEPAALAYGLQAAIAAGAPNANYVKKAAGGYKPSVHRVQVEPVSAAVPEFVEYV